MQIFRSLEEIPAGYGPAVVSIGNFDGVHRAHQRVLKALVHRAHQIRGRAIAITFDPHPTRILRPDAAPKLLTPQSLKLRKIAETGVDAVLVLPFTRDLSMMSPREFVQHILVEKLATKEVHEGFNFHFGHKAQGDIHQLEAAQSHRFEQPGAQTDRCRRNVSCAHTAWKILQCRLAPGPRSRTRAQIHRTDD
jgi:riboflavin kinase/FMN adenylyltransferase